MKNLTYLAFGLQLFLWNTANTTAAIVQERLIVDNGVQGTTPIAYEVFDEISPGGLGVRGQIITDGTLGLITDANVIGKAIYMYNGPNLVERLHIVSIRSITATQDGLFYGPGRQAAMELAPPRAESHLNATGPTRFPGGTMSS